MAGKIPKRFGFFLHAKGGAGDYNEEQKAHGSAELITAMEYLATSRFWFESYQNWQRRILSGWINGGPYSCSSREGIKGIETRCHAAWRIR